MVPDSHSNETGTSHLCVILTQPDIFSLCLCTLELKSTCARHALRDSGCFSFWKPPLGGIWERSQSVFVAININLPEKNYDVFEVGINESKCKINPIRWHNYCCEPGFAWKLVSVHRTNFKFSMIRK